MELVGIDDVIIQEMIPGTGVAQLSYAGVWLRGEPVAAMVARRTRQYTIEFGRSSTYVETVDNREVEEAGCRFLKSLNSTGVAELEFKYDARERRLQAARRQWPEFWTWNALGAAAGTDFAHLAWKVGAR